MTRQKRYPLLLEMDFPPEREVVDVLAALPEGERGAFLRTCVLVGHREIRAEQQRDREPGAAAQDTAGGVNA